MPHTIWEWVPAFGTVARKYWAGNTRVPLNSFLGSNNASFQDYQKVHTVQLELESVGKVADNFPAWHRVVDLAAKMRVLVCLGWAQEQLAGDRVEP